MIAKRGWFFILESFAEIIMASAAEKENLRALSLKKEIKINKIVNFLSEQKGKKLTFKFEGHKSISNKFENTRKSIQLVIKQYDNARYLIKFFKKIFS